MGIAEKDRWKYVVGYGAGGAIIGGVIGGFFGYDVGAALGVSYGSALASSAVSNAILAANSQKTGHIMATEHAWDKVLWNGVSKVIQNVMNSCIVHSLIAFCCFYSLGIRSIF